MKVALLTLASVVSTTLSGLAFEPWTNKEGKTIDLDLVSKSEKEGEWVGTFRMRNGKTVEVAASDLNEESAAKLEEWTAETSGDAASGEAKPSVFDDQLDGNLVQLDGKRLKRLKEFQAPSKYYLFYYTASWCGPCQKFTPSLVDFYNDNKDDSFELILVTSDSSEDAMEEYARDKEMPWPQLKLSKAAKFKKEFRHPGGGIPNLVLTDLDGKLLKTSYVDGSYVGPATVMEHLGTLLKD